MMNQIITNKNFVEPILNWYEVYKRDLPWRKSNNPYAIWVSEIMLQQTRVETVIPYYQRFIAELPTIESLATVSEQKLLTLWQGLGYYNRARNMQVAARQISNEYNGIFPSTKENILKLKGIGQYTSSAIASIAFEEKTPVVDGNVLRVIARVTGYGENVLEEKVKNIFYELLLPLMPKNKSGNFNQGIMDLGATICIPNGVPVCDKCPLKNTCYAHNNNLEKELPVLVKNNKRKIENISILIIKQKLKYAIRKRNSGLLANMYEFINFPTFLTIQEVKNEITKFGFECKSIKVLGTDKHVFTHITWNMLVYEIEIKQSYKIKHEINKTSESANNILFTNLSSLSNYPMPTAFTKLIKPSK